MTPKVIIVMLIWAGAPPAGTPATITGFRTIGDCERAVPTVTDVYNKSPVNTEAVAKSKCVSLEAGEAPRFQMAGHTGRHHN
jgi:hypothetical protein